MIHLCFLHIHKKEQMKKKKTRRRRSEHLRGKCRAERETAEKRILLLLDKFHCRIIIGELSLEPNKFRFMFRYLKHFRMSAHIARGKSTFAAILRQLAELRRVFGFPNSKKKINCRILKITYCD